LFDAAHAAIEAAGAASAAAQIRDAVENGEAYRRRDRDRFKVWPTNRDQPGYEEVMTASPPVDYASLQHPNERLVEAHRFFAECVTAYLADDDDLVKRADALAMALLHSLQIVVIQLNPEENAQEIFETLNARGTPLSAADLIKNLVFQRLSAAGEDTERYYEEHWRQLETGFWEEQVAQGRLRHPRISLFFNHWLIAATGSEVVTTEVFRTFKRFLDESDVSLGKLLADIASQAANYKALVEAGDAAGDLDRLSTFIYRTRVMGMEVTKPLVMWLTDPIQDPCPDEAIIEAVSAVESWLVRRMIVGATTKAYNRILLDLLEELQARPRDEVGAATVTYLRNLNSFWSYWPGDDEVKTALASNPIYRKLPRNRMRMVLEALEDRARGYWSAASPLMAEQQVERDAFTVEHIMPQEWRANWPLGEVDPTDRNLLVQTLGNLTLLTQKFNSSVSNARWTGPKGKREALKKHSVLRLNMEVIEHEAWDEQLIRERTARMTESILSLWPVPAGHKGLVHVPASVGGELTVLDLINGGFLEAGQRLRGRGKAKDAIAIVLPDGELEVEGVRHKTPSGAGRAARGRGVNGWWFWQDPTSGMTLRQLANDYRASTGEADRGDEDELDEVET
jgi:hypothetical protein